MALDDNGISQFREQEIEEAGIEMFRTSDLGSVTRCFKHMVKLYRYLKSNKKDITSFYLTFIITKMNTMLKTTINESKQ